VNDLYTAWLEQIYERDTFYLIILAVVATAALYYGWLKLARYFKLVLAAVLVVVAAGIIWGYTQLP